MELSSQRLDEFKKLKLDEYARLFDICAAKIKDETRNVRSLRLGSTQKDANKKLQQEFRELQIQHFQMKEQYDDLQEKLKFFTKESALDFTEFELTELEDALVLVKQKKQRAMPEPDFLQRVDAEINQDLSASVLPLTTPKINQTPNEMQKNRPDVSLSKSKERTGNSLDWSNNSKQDSKQDSKDIPLGNNHLIDTVKKRPPKVPVQEVAPSSQHILQGAVSLFTGCLLENVEETNELDQSVYNFELGADALQQLDANFADLDRERSSTDEGSFSDDENFDFDAEPMFALPDRKINIVGENGHRVSLVSKRDGCQAGSNSDSIYFREQEQTREACNSKIYKEEGRHSSCHTSEKDVNHLQHLRNSLNDISASVLPLTTPKINQMEKNRPDVSLSKSKERTGNSLDWSNNSRQDSKQDSKDIPLGNNHLIDTVKKRPPQVPVQKVAPSSQHILQGAVSLFTGCLLENVEETNELDQSVYNFELGADVLQQLDANFADLGDRERSFTDEDRFSDDENFDFDAEPMFALPDRKINIVGENGHRVSLVSKRDGCQAGSNSDSIYFREQEQTREACNSKIYKEEGRHSSCHTSEKDVNHLQHLRNSLNDISASVLPLTTPKINQMEKNRPDVSLSKSKERTGNSLDWSNNSRQDSKQDSKDIPLGNNHLIDTVKKRPPQVPVQVVAPSSQHILQGAVSLFTGCLLENVEETNELDQSVYNFELGADVLQQLDANFADLGDRERSFTDEDRFSDDENFDFDAEPMFALPDWKINIVGENGHHVSLVSKRYSCLAGSNSDSIYFREQEQTREACNSKIYKEEGRHSSCHTSEKDVNHLQHLRNSLNDISASVLPLTTPKINQMEKNRPDVSLSKSKERTGNSLDWSNNSRQDSKQDSKDIPLGNNHLIDTVKKRPPQVPVQKVAPSSQHILQGAVSLFTGCLLENVEETNELDQSVYNFELGADVLQQLDANFADLGDRERSFTDEDRFSDDENFDFDAEPMFALPDRKINIVGENGHHVSLVSKRYSCLAGSNSDSIYFREQEQTREACNSKIYKEEGRHSSCHTSEKDVNHLQHLRNSLNDISASVLPLTTPKINQMEKNRPDVSLSKSKERTGNSLDWSNNSRQDSKQDSKDIPLGNNHLIDTVKKRPPQVPVQKVAPSSQHILQGAVSLFTGCLLENVEETNELDQSVYNFELGADVLQQLDANFADLGDRERSFTDEDRFSDDENFDFDAEPMFALPDRKINII